MSSKQQLHKSAVSASRSKVYFSGYDSSSSEIDEEEEEDSFEESEELKGEGVSGKSSTLFRPSPEKPRKKRRKVKKKGRAVHQAKQLEQGLILEEAPPLGSMRNVDATSKSHNTSMEPSNLNDTGKTEKGADEMEPTFRESRVSKKFSELTTKRVVILVLCVILMMPIFQLDTYFADVTPQEYAMLIVRDTIHLECSDNEEEVKIFKTIIGNLQRNFDQEQDSKLIEIAFTNCTGETEVFIYRDLEDLRNQEYEQVSSLDPAVSILVDVKQNNIYNAVLSSAKTLFICFLLLAGALTISKDAQELVLRPLEYIMEKVNKMAEDPFQVFSFDFDELEEQKN